MDCINNEVPCKHPRKVIALDMNRTKVKCIRHIPKHSWQCLQWLQFKFPKNENAIGQFSIGIIFLAHCRPCISHCNAFEDQGLFFSPRLSKVSANERRRYIRNVFSHWVKPCSAIDRKQTQVSLDKNYLQGCTWSSQILPWLEHHNRMPE